MVGTLRAALGPSMWRVMFYDLNLSLWMKSYGVAIQRKPLQQYFHMGLFF